jgi:hypothetical protein
VNNAQFPICIASLLAGSRMRRFERILFISAFFLILIANRFRSFERDEAAAHHFIKHRQERVYLFLGVHDFNYNWKVHGQAKDFRSVQVT